MQWFDLLHSDAASLLVDILLTVDETDQEDCISRLLDAIQKQPCTFCECFVSFVCDALILNSLISC